MPTVLVLHDVAGGAMDHFDRFLDCVDAAGIEVVVDPPTDVTPILAGQLIGSIDGLLPV